MSIYNSIAEKLQYITPEFYKDRFFKKLKNLSKENVFQRNIEPELLWIKNLVKKDSVILEIGANVGAYLYLLENEIVNKNIFAFEPNQKLFARLKRLFPEMQIFPFAVSDENKTATFKIPIINGKAISSRGTLKTDFVEKDEERTITQVVEVVKLDDWVVMMDLKKIDFIKIDVEGNEMHTLHGAKKTLQKFTPIVMVEMEQRHHEEPLWNLISEITSWNYLPYYLNRTTLQLAPLSQDVIISQNSDLLKDKNNYINNIIFIPKK